MLLTNAFAVALTGIALVASMFDATNLTVLCALGGFAFACGIIHERLNND